MSAINALFWGWGVLLAPLKAGVPPAPARAALAAQCAWVQQQRDGAGGAEPLVTMSLCSRVGV